MKYKLGEKHPTENLYRIVALKDFANIKEGTVGGWVKGEHNLAQEGNCWVHEDARVYGNARVSEDAQVYGGVSQKREWVGLTEAERIDIIDDEITSQNTEHFALAQTIEARLKEKNGG